jgi:hypothetical protein
MTIVGKDGQARYIVEDTTITDLLSTDRCSCEHQERPEQRNGEQRVCLVCGKPINHEEN